MIRLTPDNGIPRRILLMMAVIHSKNSKMPEEKLDAEAKTILATYGKKEDFVDYVSLEKLGSVIQ